MVCTTTFVAPSTAENSQNLLCMIDWPYLGSPRQDLCAGQSVTKDGLVLVVPRAVFNWVYDVLVGRSLTLDSSSSICTFTPRFLAATSASTTDCSHTW